MSVLVFLWAGAAWAVPQDDKSFGDCGVQTQIDDFTDETNYSLYCLKKDDTGVRNLVLVTCTNDGWLAGFQGVSQFHLGEKIAVMYRFDKGELIRGEWFFLSPDSAVATDVQTYKNIINRIRVSERVIFKIGDEQGAVNLSGGALAADEFEKRCEDYGP